MGRKLQLGGLLAILAFAGGCTPAYYAFERELDEIRALVEGVQPGDAQATSQMPVGAGPAAARAQATADEALAAANAAQAAVDATNERIDRMFEDEQAK